ncbi:unnamed protein product [Phaeothamnion confervicola]
MENRRTDSLQAEAAAVRRMDWHASPLARRFVIHNGKIYFGPYEVTKTLGRGMQAKVKLARDTETNELVALKVVDVSGIGPRHLLHIQREVTALRRIQHPNVLRLQDVVEGALLPRGKDMADKDVMVMVLDLAAGGELFEFMLYTGFFPEVIARTYMVQLVSALAHCHRLGIYHRDIKPENILLDANFQLKLADFGLSGTVKADGSDVCMTYCGTRAYMAPEVLSDVGSYGGAKADVWSAAVVLFIMLAGSPPMRLANSSDWWFKAIMLGLHDKFWQAHERVCPHFPRSAQPTLNRMFVADPAKRASVEELLADDPWMAKERMTDDMLFQQMRARKEAMDQKKEAERLAVLQKKQVELNSKRRNQVYDAFERDVKRAAPLKLSAADAAAGSSLRLPPPAHVLGADEGEAGSGPAAYAVIYLMGAMPEELLGRVASACAAAGAKAVKVKADAWVVKATFPSDDPTALDPTPRAQMVFRFFALQQAVDPADATAGVHLLTYVVPERVAGDVFAAREVVCDLCARLGDAVCVGEEESVGPSWKSLSTEPTTPLQVV